MIYVADLKAIHEIITERFANSDDPVSPPGVKSEELLASAAGRPFQTINEEDAYPSAFLKAAALFHSLINNHAFHNGNKRCALVAAQVALAEDRFWLEDATDDEMFEFTRMAAAHELVDNRQDEVSYIADWFDQKSRKQIGGEHPLKFQSLKEILNRFGLEVDSPNKSILNITRDGEAIASIIKQGMQGFRPYHTDYISRLRRQLGLTAENGIDSARFYGQKGVKDIASVFVDLRIEVMQRLAKT